MRWSTTEGAVLQAIGRPRGVRRGAGQPVRVVVLAALALPLTVDEVMTWDEIQPDRLTVAAAEASLMGRALPLAPTDLAACRPDLWPSAKAAERFMEDRCRFETPQPLIGDSYKGLGGFKTLTPARYRRGLRGRWSAALVPLEGGQAALEALIGRVTAYEEIVAEQAACPAQPPVETWSPAATVPPPPVPLVVVPLRVVTLAERQAALAVQAARLAVLDRRLEAVRPPAAEGERVINWRERQALARAAWSTAPPPTAWAPYPSHRDAHR